MTLPCSKCGNPRPATPTQIADAASALPQHRRLLYCDDCTSRKPEFVAMVAAELGQLRPLKLRGPEPSVPVVKVEGVWRQAIEIIAAPWRELR